MRRPLWVEDMVADFFVAIVFDDKERIERVRQGMVNQLSPEDCDYVFVEVDRALARYRRNQGRALSGWPVVDGAAPPRPVMPVGGLAERLIAKVGGDVEAVRAKIRQAHDRAAFAALYAVEKFDEQVIDERTADEKRTEAAFVAAEGRVRGFEDVGLAHYFETGDVIEPDGFAEALAASAECKWQWVAAVLEARRRRGLKGEW